MGKSPADAVANSHFDEEKADSDEVLTIEQAARLLALSTRTLERYVEEALIPYVRQPRRGSRTTIRFLRSELMRWLQNQMVRPLKVRREKVTE